MRKFRVYHLVSTTIEISEDLLSSVLTDDWRKQFYKFTKPEEVAEHLVYNMARGTSLQSIDGYADQPNTAVDMKWPEWEVDETRETTGEK